MDSSKKETDVVEAVEQSKLPVRAVNPNPLNIDKARAILINEEPYFACLLQACHFRWDERVKTAGVSVTRRANVELVVAPSFWNSLNGFEGVGLLKHEMLHLLHEHLTRGKELNPKMANIAMDIAINQFIKRHQLPEGGLLNDGLHLPNGPKLPGQAETDKLIKSLKLEENRTFEIYYLALLKKKQELDQTSPMDNHEWQSGDGEGDEGEPQEGEEGEGPAKGAVADELRKAAIDNVLRQALQDSKDRYPGRTPMHVEQLMNDRFRPARIDWRKALRSYIGRKMSTHIESTRTRLNRRLGLLAPGYRRTYTPKILIGVDASGSVPNEMYVCFMNEIKAILKGQDDKTEIFFFDHTVCDFKLKLSTMKEIPKRPACGGTSFAAALAYATEQKPDLCIILTDGGDSPPPKPNYPVIWAIYGKAYGDLFGKVIEVDEKLAGDL
jgi:predicted metal-dependent peptidase